MAVDRLDLSNIKGAPWRPNGDPVYARNGFASAQFKTVATQPTHVDRRMSGLETHRHAPNNNSLPNEIQSFNCIDDSCITESIQPPMTSLAISNNFPLTPGGVDQHFKSTK